ncbi:sensor histidine kinase [Actinomycetospora atypica]|uniref:Sensor histidine kinase n=1 Tax=Actinomycetospora atypica TaxID=1290095 RepID=A0ABV9YK18_9PSEU
MTDVATARVADVAPHRAAPSRVLLPALVAGIAVVVFAGVVVLEVLARDLRSPADAGLDDAWLSGLVGLALTISGAAVLRVRPRHPVAWVLVVAGLGWSLTALAVPWTLLAIDAGSLTSAGIAYRILARYGAFLLLGLPLVLLLYPDGHLPRPRGWRVAALVSLASTAVLPVTLLVVPSAEIYARGGPPVDPVLLALPLDPMTFAMPYWPQVLAVGSALLPVSIVVPFAVVVGRYRRAAAVPDGPKSDGADVRRLRMRWLLWVGLVDLLATGSALALPEPVRSWVFYGAICLTGAVVALALARDRLDAVDRLLPATVLTGLLAVGVVAVDLVVLLVAGAVLGDRDSALLAVAVVAVAYTPLRTRLWTLSRRLVRGTRDDPEGTVATLAGRLESAAAPDAQLAALARTVSEAFRLPGVRVEVDRADGARATVEHGRPGTGVVELPLRYRDEAIGRVALPARAFGALSARDQQLLADLLRQAAAAARAGALGASLQRAREQIVTAREEERRRLRRDLHDSVGPALGAVTLRIETARELAPLDPAAADGMLRAATDDVTALLGDVRRLVHDLRPPALDELGLLGALRARARGLSGDGLEITVRGDDPGALGAAVEVAAFHIVSEALTNVVRHAGATTADVLVEREPGTLVVTVTDDGRGIDPTRAAGVGSRSLRERSAELGGSTTVSCPAGGGTVVRAELPCEEEGR